MDAAEYDTSTDARAQADAPAIHILYSAKPGGQGYYVDVLSCPVGYLVSLDEVPLVLTLSETSRLLYS